MKLYEGIEARVVIADIETLAGMFDAGFYNPDNGKWHEFQISKYKNDLYSFIKFFNKRDWDYVVGYNWIGFDGQVIEWIIQNYEDWWDLSGAEIALKISKYASWVIDNNKYNIFPTYNEKYMKIRPIDVFTLFGLDNEARRSSLKKCEYQIDFPNVEEMPIHHNTVDLTEKDVEMVQSYRRNDVLATYELFKMSIGETEHPVYKGVNLLELRASIKEEFGLDCLSSSDIKLGDDLMKQEYAKYKGIDIRDVPKKGTFRGPIDLSRCVPSYIKFKTPKMQEVLKDIKSTTLGMWEKLKIPFEFYGTKYTIAMGGLHSKNDNEVYISDILGDIFDWDVQSYYPKGIIGNKVFPKHLGVELLKTYEFMYNRRIELKPLGKKDKKIKGVVEAIKLMLNSVFGKLGMMDGWLYDKLAFLKVTLGGQLSLMMLVEMLELEGVHVFSANTDGITFKTDKIATIKAVWEKWEEITGYALEEAKYKRINYISVNSYIAEKWDGEIKKKDECMTDHELWKVKDKRVIPLAIEDWFKHTTDPEKFITDHKNIYDFCSMLRATGDNYIEEQKDDGTTIKYKKLIRYYLTNSGDGQLFRRGTGTTGKQLNVNQNAPNELGKIYTKYFNQWTQEPDYHIDRRQYILKAYQIIDGWQKTKKAKAYIDRCNNSSQLGFGF